MFKALKRIGTDKTVFDIEVRPINVSIYTNHPFDCKLEVQRGKQAPEATGQKKVGRSLKNTDIKIVSFTEKFNLPCTMFLKDGVPEEKTCTLSVVKLFPDGDQKVIATKEVNLCNHFGEEF